VRCATARRSRRIVCSERSATSGATSAVGANVVAAYHHDHVFVATADAERAIQILRDLQAEVLAPP
jgi:hypothetical protein